MGEKKINKVSYGSETLIDLTSDTVIAETLVKGVTAHDAAGNEITGTYEAPIYWVNITASDNIYTSDKSFDEISQVLTAGKLVCASIPSVGHGERYFYGFVTSRGKTINSLQVFAPTRDGIWGFNCSSGNTWTQYDSKRFTASYELPQKAGTANKGSSEYFALADHVHPAELPTVTTADNDKVLRVVDGEWTAVSENFTVTATATSLAATTATIDKTLAQIEAAYQAGMTLICKLVISGSTGAIMNLTTAQRNTATGNFIFSGIGVVIPDGGTASCYAGYIYISSSGATVSMNLIPADGNGVSY